MSAVAGPGSRRLQRRHEAVDSHGVETAMQQVIPVKGSLCRVRRRSVGPALEVALYAQPFDAKPAAPEREPFIAQTLDAVIAKCGSRLRFDDVRQAQVNGDPRPDQQGEQQGDSGENAAGAHDPMPGCVEPLINQTLI